MKILMSWMKVTLIFSHVLEESGTGYVSMNSHSVLKLKFHARMEPIAQTKDTVFKYGVHALTGELQILNLHVIMTEILSHSSVAE